MSLAPPQPKKFRGDHQPGDPLPIPIADLTGFPSSAASWNYYRGIYRNGAVLVSDFNHIAALWHNGYFGQIKNTSDHNSDDRIFPFQKKWKLLQSEGLKDANFFKKTVEVDDCDTSEDEKLVSADDSENIDLSDKKDTSLSYVDTGDHSRKQESVQECSSENFEGVDEKGLRKSDKTSSKPKKEMEEEIKNKNIKTLITFDSDLVSSVFFDENNVDSPSGYLELLLEEAMFLSYALGCLVVEWDVGSGGQQRKAKRKDCALNIDQMWREFVSDDPKFVVRYAVYHHYRTKGWVVKSGLKFGADFVLYPVGPPFYHAQFTVMIQCIWADNNERDDSLSGREMSWINLSATERLNSHVKKTPIIAYVLRPRNLTLQDLYNISCMQSLTIKEVVLSRWDPSAIKEPDKDEIVLD